MHYKELNEKQKEKMKQICDRSYMMQWEDADFYNYLCGGLPIMI